MLLAVCKIFFDLYKGTILDSVYPPTFNEPYIIEYIENNCMPDSNSSKIERDKFYFTLNDVYCYVCFIQELDAEQKRNCKAYSYVLISDIDFVGEDLVIKLIHLNVKDVFFYVYEVLRVHYEQDSSEDELMPGFIRNINENSFICEKCLSNTNISRADICEYVANEAMMNLQSINEFDFNEKIPCKHKDVSDIHCSSSLGGDDLTINDMDLANSCNNELENRYHIAEKNDREHLNAIDTFDCSDDLPVNNSKILDNTLTTSPDTSETKKEILSLEKVDSIKSVDKNYVASSQPEQDLQTLSNDKGDKKSSPIDKYKMEYMQAVYSSDNKKYTPDNTVNELKAINSDLFVQNDICLNNDIAHKDDKIFQKDGFNEDSVLLRNKPIIKFFGESDYARYTTNDQLATQKANHAKCLGHNIRDDINSVSTKLLNFYKTSKKIFINKKKPGLHRSESFEDKQKIRKKNKVKTKDKESDERTSNLFGELKTFYSKNAEFSNQNNCIKPSKCFDIVDKKICEKNLHKNDHLTTKSIQTSHTPLSDKPENDFDVKTYDATKDNTKAEFKQEYSLNNAVPETSYPKKIIDDNKEDETKEIIYDLKRIIKNDQNYQNNPDKNLQNVSDYKNNQFFMNNDWLDKIQFTSKNCKLCKNNMILSLSKAKDRFLDGIFANYLDENLNITIGSFPFSAETSAGNKDNSKSDIGDNKIIRNIGQKNKQELTRHTYYVAKTSFDLDMNVNTHQSRSRAKSRPSRKATSLQKFLNCVKEKYQTSFVQNDYYHFMNNSYNKTFFTTLQYKQYENNSCHVFYKDLKNLLEYIIFDNRIVVISTYPSKITSFMRYVLSLIRPFKYSGCYHPFIGLLNINRINYAQNWIIGVTHKSVSSKLNSNIEIDLDNSKIETKNKVKYANLLAKYNFENYSFQDILGSIKPKHKNHADFMNDMKTSRLYQQNKEKITLYMSKNYKYRSKSNNR
ncbi:hypothetical protein COBT_002834, partial [Conglomerata obtusa]